MKYGSVGFFLAILLSGCGGGITSANDGNETTVVSTEEPSPVGSKAYYVDDPIVNIRYHCGRYEGTTDGEGGFYFEEGEPCRFSLATLEIRRIEASHLTPGVYIVESDPTVAALLQSLDGDGMEDDRIRIDDGTIEAIREHNMTDLPRTFEARQKMIAVLNAERNSSHMLQVRTRNEAFDHLKEQAERYRAFDHYFTVPFVQDEEAVESGEDNGSLTSPEIDDADGMGNGTTTQASPDGSTNSSGNSDSDDPDQSVDHTTETDEQNLSTDGGTDTSSAEKGTSLLYTKMDEHLYLNEKKDVAIYLSSEINKSAKLIYQNDKVQEITHTIYRHFNDAYDFIFLITNNKEQPTTVSYSGVFLKVKNDVEGIGSPLYSNSDRYGSAGNLKGIMHFAYRGAVLRGPTLHEISHYWANKFRVGYTDTGAIDYTTYMIGKSGHWGYMGFFGGKGQLGGFDAQNGDFRIEKDANGNDITYESKRDGTWKIYSAKDFSWNANGAGRIPYNDLELYLMGFIPKEEVADMLVPLSYGSPLVPETKDLLVENNLTESGRNYFMAREVVRKSWEEIMNDHNISERKPNAQNAQKSFRVLTVLLDTQMPKPHEVNSISLQMEKFTRQGDDGIPTNHNFWEATKGLGTLHADGLDASLKTEGEEYPVENDFTSEEISFHGKTYRTIRSPYTGRIWLDRNIGADRVCQSLTDEACYGGYFEFGRGFDGHQLPNSPAQKEKKETITPNDNVFVLSDYNVGYDWVVDGVDDNGSKRIAFMNDLEGNGICPVGFRLPSMDELYAETLTNEPWDAFPAQNIEDDFLKLPFNGYRNAQHTQGLITEKDERGAYWTNSTYLSDGKLRVRHMMFTKDDVLGYGTRYIGNGEGIRCIKAE